MRRDKAYRRRASAAVDLLAAASICLHGCTFLSLAVARLGLGSSAARRAACSTSSLWGVASRHPSAALRRSLPGARVEDTGSARGKILVLARDVQEGQLICRDAAMWVMREGVDFEVQTTADGRCTFRYREGSQTVMDGFYALTPPERDQVLQLFCGVAPSDGLRMRFGASGERVGQLLRIPTNESTAEAWKALQVFQRNGQATQLSTGKFIVAVYPVLSRICHSCIPNINYEVAGDGFLEVTAKWPLAAGAELCQSYLTAEELAWPTPQRQEKTLRVWGFKCDCPRCQSSLSCPRPPQT